MCCINKKFQLEFLTLPSKVKVSCVPGQNTTLSSYFIKTKHRASPHSQVLYQKPHNPRTSWAGRSITVFQYPSAAYGNTLCMWMLYSQVICSSQLLCSRKSSEQPIPHCSHVPLRSCRVIHVTIPVPKYLWTPLPSVMGSWLQSCRTARSVLISTLRITDSSEASWGRS